MSKLDRRFHDWLQKIEEKWSVPIELVAVHIGREEIKNRLNIYPSIKKYLQEDPVPWNSVFALLRTCWALGGRFDTIRFNEFVEHGDKSIAALIGLLRSPSQARTEAVDDFVRSAIKLGYINRNRGTADQPGAALLASVILTCADPTRFVDYRRSRWKHFATALDYPFPPSPKSEGAWIVWAGEFAREVAQTQTYINLWGAQPELWTLAGICWDARNPKPPIPDPPDPGEDHAYTEGDAKRRLHLIRERNASLVRRAKELRERTDPGLHCETCDFSYRDRYGERGAGFIEAHHKIPLAQLRPGTPTRVEDIVLLCSNCHRMIHQDPALTAEELRKLASGIGHMLKG